MKPACLGVNKHEYIRPLSKHRGRKADIHVAAHLRGQKMVIYISGLIFYDAVMRKESRR